MTEAPTAAPVTEAPTAAPVTPKYQAGDLFKLELEPTKEPLPSLKVDPNWNPLSGFKGWKIEPEPEVEIDPIWNDWFDGSATVDVGCNFCDSDWMRRRRLVMGETVGEILCAMLKESPYAAYENVGCCNIELEFV